MREEDWRRDRRDEQARAQHRKGRLGVERKQGASGRGKVEKRVSGKTRETKRGGGDIEEGTRGRVTGTEASRGGGGGGGGGVGIGRADGASGGREREILNL